MFGNKNENDMKKAGKSRKKKIILIPFRIEQEHCLHCGNCMKVCPVGAMQKR